jgi:hypothetical protein
MNPVLKEIGRLPESCVCPVCDRVHTHMFYAFEMAVNCHPDFIYQCSECGRWHTSFNRAEICCQEEEEE